MTVGRTPTPEQSRPPRGFTRDEWMLARFVSERPVWRDMYAEGPEGWKAIESLLVYQWWRLGAEFGELGRALLEAVRDNRLIVVALIVSGLLILASYVLVPS